MPKKIENPSLSHGELSKGSKILIIYRPHTEKAFELTKRLCLWLHERQVKVYTVSKEKKRIPHSINLAPNSKILEEIQLVISLGGDGTYLRAVRLINTQPIPVLGVNLGSLGFLTPFNSQGLFSTLKKSQHLKVSNRTLLQIRIINRNETKTFLALNDIVIERGLASQLIDLSLFSARQLVSHIKADGLIVATPTGSTAYNLSAGGPILHPETQAIVVTPVAPHTLTHRPLVFPDSKEIRIKIKPSNKNMNSTLSKARINVDGQFIKDLFLQDEILITKSPSYHYLVQNHLSDFDFFELLKLKLKFGERT